MSRKKITSSSLRQAIYDILLPRWRRILLGIFLIIIGRLAVLVLPAASRYLVDNIFTSGNLEDLSWLLAGVGVAVIIQAVSGYILVRLLSVEAHNLINRLRVNIQKHILKLPMTFFYQERSGSIVARIMNDVEGVRNLLGTGLVQLFGGMLSAGLALFFLFRINFPMTLSSLIVLAIFGVVMIQTFKVIRPIFRKRNELNSQVSGRLTETIGGIKVVKGFAAEEREQKVFQEGAYSLFENVKKTLTATALVTMITLLLTGIIAGIVMAFSANAVVNDEMTSGDFVAYLLYLGMLTFPIVQISNIGTQITESLAGLDRMNEIYSLTTEDDNPQRKQNLKSIQKGIVFEDVYYTYSHETDFSQYTEKEGGGEKDVIKGVSFSIKKGEVVALVGSSGSGKSTLASLAISLLTPTQGRITVDGIDLTTISLPSYRKKLAVVFQDDFFFDGTLKENLLFASPQATQTEIRKATAAAHVDEYADQFPQGINTIIGERGVKLSGGQKQRLSIARAILANPKFLVLDEATSSLDSISENYIRESLKKLVEHRTTLIIAHRLSTIKRANTILVVEDGRIVERGNHKTLLAKKGNYYKLYTYQAKI